MGALVGGDLVSMLNRHGIRVEHTMTNLKKDQGEPRWEIDSLAVNGDELLVEVKTTLKVRHVDHLLDLLQVSRVAEGVPQREVYGAVAHLKAGGRGHREAVGRQVDRRQPMPNDRAVRDLRHRQQREHRQPRRLPPPAVRAPRRIAR